MSDSQDEHSTPATVPYKTEEHAILLNGKVLTESDSRRPHPDLPIHGRVAGDGQIDGDLVSVRAVLDVDGVSSVYVNVLDTDTWADMTYELRRSDRQPDSGQRWETHHLDPEYTVDIVPISEVTP